jgi:hypothetical protein
LSLSNTELLKIAVVIKQLRELRLCDIFEETLYIFGAGD